MVDQKRQIKIAEWLNIEYYVICKFVNHKKSYSVFRIKHNDTYLFRPSLPMESNIELQIRNI